MKAFTQCSLPQIGVSLDGNDFAADLQYLCKPDLQYLCNDKLKLLHALFRGCLNINNLSNKMNDLRLYDTNDCPKS